MKNCEVVGVGEMALRVVQRQKKTHVFEVLAEVQGGCGFELKVRLANLIEVCGFADGGNLQPFDVVSVFKHLWW